MEVVYIRPRTNFHANKGRQRERERADAPLSRDSEHGHKQNTYLHSRRGGGAYVYASTNTKANLDRYARPSCSPRSLATPVRFQRRSQTQSRVPSPIFPPNRKPCRDTRLAPHRFVCQFFLSRVCRSDRTQSGQPFNQAYQCRRSLFWHRYSVLEKIPVLREASRDIDRSEAAVFVRSLYPIDSPRLLLVNIERSLFGYVHCLVYLAIGRNSQDFEQVCCFSNFKFQFSLFVTLIIFLAKRNNKRVNFLK